MQSVRASALFRTTRRAVAEGMGGDPHAVWLDYESPASLAARAPEYLRGPLEALAEHNSPAAHREASAALQAHIAGTVRHVSREMGTTLRLDVSLTPKGARPFAFARRVLDIVHLVAARDIVKAEVFLSTTDFREGRAGFLVHTAFDFARFRSRHHIQIRLPWCTAFAETTSAAGKRLLHHLGRWSAPSQDDTASDLVPLRFLPDRRLRFFDPQRHWRYSSGQGFSGDIFSGIHTEVDALAGELETALGRPRCYGGDEVARALTAQIADRQLTAQVLWDQCEPLLSAAATVGRRDLRTVVDDLGRGLGDRALVTDAGALVYLSTDVHRGRPAGTDWSLDPETMRHIAATHLASAAFHRQAIDDVDARVLQMMY